MNSESIAALGMISEQMRGVSAGAGAFATPTGQHLASTSFSGLVTQGLDAVNRQLIGSQVDLQQLSVGNVENLHQVMIRLEESRLSFQLAMQVRNRFLEAYQDVMKMQI